MSIADTITIEDAIRVLNRMLEADPVATQSLVQKRVPCNQALANDPMVQVHSTPVFRIKPGPLGRHVGERIGQDHKVGLLGVVNGLFGKDGDDWGPIAAVYDDHTGRLQRFTRLISPGPTPINLARADAE